MYVASVPPLARATTGDISKNGIWVMNADGSNQLNVLSASAGQQISVSRTHSVSLAGDLFAANMANQDNTTISLMYGSTSSADTTSFFTLATSAGFANIVGWVTA